MLHGTNWIILPGYFIGGSNPAISMNACGRGTSAGPGASTFGKVGMETQSRTEQRIYLERALAKAEANDFSGAFVALNEARKCGLTNLYVAAIERQIESLFALSRQGELTLGSRNELLEPLDGLVERALGEDPFDASSEKVAPEKLDALKVQCFRAASAHLEKGEYDRALLEISRIFLFDPHDASAHEYESRLKELKALRRDQHREAIPRAHPAPRKVSPPAKIDGRSAKMMSRSKRNNIVLTALSAILLLAIVAMVFLPPGESQNAQSTTGTLGIQREMVPTTTPMPTSPAEPLVAVERGSQIVRMEQPHFPDSIRISGVEGQVIVRVFVDERGNPVKVRVVKSTSSLLEGPVVEAVMRWKFSPATMSKQPVAAWITIPLKFKKNG